MTSSLSEQPKSESTSSSREVPFRKRYFAAGILGRAVGSRLRKQQSTGRSSHTLRIADRAMRRLSSNELAPLAEADREVIKAAFDSTKTWHGTGRYQYRDGQVTDVLGYIAKNGKLQPQPDALDFTGPMESLSLAPARMYARAYADMHGKGAAESERHGSSMFWAWTFLGDVGVEAALEGRAWTRAGLRATRTHFDKGGAVDWYQKVGQNYMGTMELFRRGSDIEGNYPILFGVRDGAFEPVKTSRSIAIHEVRSLEPLSLADDITHIEVPRERVMADQGMLRQSGYAIPVLAIEDCERYVAEMPFTELMKNNMLSSQLR